MRKELLWEDCIFNKSCLKTLPDKAKAKSLIDTAKGRIDYSQRNVMDKTSANYIFENYYTSMLELLHAVVILNGFKVRNHICLGFYLRDVLTREDLFSLFDDCRSKRNSLVYSGKRMEFEVAKESVSKCKILIKELSKLI
ncbi:hypothetical protein CL616_01485 [archaeon]|nr:hypothetical protein [archaeon]